MTRQEKLRELIANYNQLLEQLALREYDGTHEEQAKRVEEAQEKMKQFGLDTMAIGMAMKYTEPGDGRY